MDVGVNAQYEGPYQQLCGLAWRRGCTQWTTGQLDPPASTCDQYRITTLYPHIRLACQPLPPLQSCLTRVPYQVTWAPRSWVPAPNGCCPT